MGPKRNAKPTSKGKKAPLKNTRSVKKVVAVPKLTTRKKGVKKRGRVAKKVVPARKDEQKCITLEDIARVKNLSTCNSCKGVWFDRTLFEKHLLTCGILKINEELSKKKCENHLEIKSKTENEDDLGILKQNKSTNENVKEDMNVILNKKTKVEKNIGLQSIMSNKVQSLLFASKSSGHDQKEDVFQNGIEKQVSISASNLRKNIASSLLKSNKNLPTARPTRSSGLSFSSENHRLVSLNSEQEVIKNAENNVTNAESLRIVTAEVHNDGSPVRGTKSVIKADLKALASQRPIRGKKLLKDDSEFIVSKVKNDEVQCITVNSPKRRGRPSKKKSEDLTDKEDALICNSKKVSFHTSDEKNSIIDYVNEKNNSTDHAFVGRQTRRGSTFQNYFKDLPLKTNKYSKKCLTVKKSINAIDTEASDESIVENKVKDNGCLKEAVEVILPGEFNENHVKDQIIYDVEGISRDDTPVIVCEPEIQSIKIEDTSDEKEELHSAIFAADDYKDSSEMSRPSTSMSIENLDGNEVTFNCAVCKRAFTRKYHLDRHLRISKCSGLPLPTFPCELCNRVYTRKDNLREHLRSHTGEVHRRKNHKCPYCDKAFHGQSLLAIHVRKHTGEKPFSCDFCPKKFPSTGALQKHRMTHTGEKPYSCNECGRRFTLKGTLSRHIRTHTGIRPHTCPFCGKKFIQIGGLNAHMFYHTGENGFKCDDCGKIFNRKARLQMHQLYVHIKLKPFVCEHCNKPFVRKEDLMRHSVLHTGEKPFKCPTCDRRFSVKPSLKLHLLTHTKEEPRSCHECGRAFIRKDCLLRHMRKRHREVFDKLLFDEKDEKDISLVNTRVLSEKDLTDNIRELLYLLIDEPTLLGFGWPDKAVDEVLELVIQRCGHTPVSKDSYSYMDRLRENAKLLFTVVIDDNAFKTLLNNQTVDEVILHVLRLAKT